MSISLVFPCSPFHTPIETNMTFSVTLKCAQKIPQSAGERSSFAQAASILELFFSGAFRGGKAIDKSQAKRGKGLWPRAASQRRMKMQWVVHAGGGGGITYEAASGLPFASVSKEAVLTCGQICLLLGK